MNNLEVCDFYKSFCANEIENLPPENLSKRKKLELAATSLIAQKPELGLSKEDVSKTATKIGRVWDKRPHRDSRPADKWKIAVAFESRNSTTPVHVGRPSKRLSEDVHQKTEDKILAPLKNT